jgi:hypothetical protein
LPRQNLALFDEDVSLRRQWRGHHLSAGDLARAGIEHACRLQHVVSGRLRHGPNHRLTKPVLNHALNRFWFLIAPTIGATSCRAKQSIGPAVWNHRASGGNRTWFDAGAQPTVTPLLVTLEQRGGDSLEPIAAARCSTVPRLFTPENRTTLPPDCFPMPSACRHNPRNLMHGP